MLSRHITVVLARINLHYITKRSFYVFTGTAGHAAEERHGDTHRPSQWPPRLPRGCEAATSLDSLPQAAGSREAKPDF